MFFAHVHARYSNKGSPMTFTHLHLNTNYSHFHGLLDAVDVARFCKGTGMTVCACTDHCMDGTLAFREAMGNEGIRPIYGMTFLVDCDASPVKWESREAVQGHIHWKGGEGIYDESRNAPVDHREPTLVCLAETLEGYRNLCAMAVSKENKRVDGNFFRSAICVSKDTLRKHHRGLIALSGGPSGEISKISALGTEAVDAAIAEYVGIFGEGNFFLELQDHGTPEERSINQALVEASMRTGVPVVATNDVHYLKRNEAMAHEVLLGIGEDYELTCIGHRFLPGGPEYYLKTPAEMEELFAWCPEAIRNTELIAERCLVEIPMALNVPEVPEGDKHKPRFKMPAGFDGTPDDYLREICVKGLQRRYGIDANAKEHTADEKKILARLQKELETLKHLGVANELLVLWNLLWDAGQETWRVYNSRRGAMAGSLVAYLMPLTDVDPIRYNLLFERFVNRKRLNGLSLIIDDYKKNLFETCLEALARECHGESKVAWLHEMSTLYDAGRFIWWVAKIMLVPSRIVNKLRMLVEKYPRYRRLVEILEEDAKLRDYVDATPDAKRVLEIADVLSRVCLNVLNGNRTLLLSDVPMWEVCPVYGRGKLDTRVDLIDAWSLGLMDVDCRRVDAFVEQTLQHVIPEDYPDDEAVYEKLRHLEDSFFCLRGDDELNELSPEQKKSFFRSQRQHGKEFGSLPPILAKVGVRSIEDIAACIALACPGTRQFLSQFVHRHNGKWRIVYDFPELEPILKETCGIILYQEQIMQIAHVLAGIPLEDADIMRRRLAHVLSGIPLLEEADIMRGMGIQCGGRDVYWRGRFVEGAVKRGFKEKAIERFWEKLIRSARFAYPKSHAIARAQLLYRVAYIRFHKLAKTV